MLNTNAKSNENNETAAGRSRVRYSLWHPLKKVSVKFEA